jgi:hypothetical protein
LSSASARQEVGFEPPNDASGRLGGQTEARRLQVRRCGRPTKLDISGTGAFVHCQDSQVAFMS